MTDEEIISICHKADGYASPKPDYLNSRDAVCKLWEALDDEDILFGLSLLGIEDGIRDMVLPTARTYATKFAEYKIRDREIAKKHCANFAAMTQEHYEEVRKINPPAFAKALKRIAEL